MGLALKFFHASDRELIKNLQRLVWLLCLGPGAFTFYFFTFRIPRSIVATDPMVGVE